WRSTCSPDCRTRPRTGRCGTPGCTSGADGRRPRAGALYLPGARFSFTYPPFAAVLFAGFSGAPAWTLKAALSAGSLVALPVLCGQALDAAGVKRRPEIVFAVSALALQTWPVAYTLHLGEVN